MARNIILCLLVFLLLPTFLFSGTTGKIAGFVQDKETGDPLVGVNILIDGTSLGAATDLSGEYYIINIPPGMYTVRASMIGYKVMKVTQVRVSTDLTTRIEYSLEQEIISGEAVTVVAERPLIQKDVTFSGTYTSAEEIENMAVNTFQEVMGFSAGIVVYGKGSYNANDQESINIRGGRSDEITYMVDGFSVKDPHSSGLAADVASSGIQDLSIITGTFNAEYGEAMSGVVNIVTKEGQADYHGTLNMSTDQFGVDKYDFNTVRGDFTLSGPLPLLGNKGNFFISTDNLNTDTYLNKVESNVHDANGNPITRVHEPFTFNQRERFTGKLVLRPLSNLKAVFGYNHYFQKQRFYDDDFKYIPDHNGIDYNTSDLYNLTLTHTLSPNTFYDLRFKWFKYRSKHELTSDIASIKKPQSSLIPEWDSNYEFYGSYLDHVDEITEWVDINGDGIIDEAVDSSYVRPDSVYSTSDDDFWQDYTTREIGIMGSITSQIHKSHLVKAGFEYKNYRIKEDRLVGINRDGILDHDEETHYHYKPIKFAFFAQDKMEFKQFIINAGFRLDYLDSKGKYFESFSNPRPDELKTAKSKYKISPRIGFGHPLTDKIRLHFAYGHFYQFPDFEMLYRRTNTRDPLGLMNPSEGYRPRIGNANLDPQTTIAYEFGTEIALSNEIVADVTIFYKDIYDYIATKFYDVDPKPYMAIVNMDYANTKGIEFSLHKRFSNHYSAGINYTWSRAEGNADDWMVHFYEYQNASVTGQVIPKKTQTLEWDRPHSLNLQFDIRWIDNWGLNVLGSFGSGLPYTPADARGKHTGEINSARMPWNGTVDIRLNKDFNFFGLRERLYANIWNLFDKENILNVYANSGKPDYSTNTNTSEENMHNPHWYGPPRTIELGVQLSF